VPITGLLRVKPNGELLKAVPGIEKNFMLGFSVVFDETDIELGRGDVNPKRSSR
jgi:hypothetical protein